jgi:hypothetical protein
MNKLRFTLVLAVVFAARVLSAATVTAELSADETSVGTPVQMQVRVDGTTHVILPDITVDGLHAEQAGRSVQTSIDLSRGRMVASGVYFYTIVPQREGTFEIPSLEVIADGKKLHTAPLKLVVQPGSGGGTRAVPSLPLPPGGAAQQRRNAPADAQGKLAYAELIVPRESVYAGELVPAEVRFYFSDGARFQLAQPEPEVEGEGFTVEKFSPPKQTEETLGDSTYQVLSFKTGLTAVKSGEMPLPTVSLHVVASVPTRGPQGADDIFSQFFGGAMPGFSENRELTIKSKPTDIRVKALPVAGRPASFSGGVGEFTMAATADPTKAEPGDPVTLKTAISGRGNFAALGEPKLVDTDGWRVYPPTDKFDKTDDIGFTGTKTFETPIVAQTPQTHTPAAEFSYFDPIKEKYVTLKSEPVAVNASATPPAAADSTAEPEATPSPTPAPARDASGSWLTKSTARSWQPLLVRPAFWISNGIAALVFAGIIAGVVVRRARSGPAGRRAAAVRRRNQLLAGLSRADLSDEAFFAGAQEVLTMQAALEGESGPFELVDAVAARGRETAGLREILARANELKFSGGSASLRMSADERRRIATALREVCR